MTGVVLFHEGELTMSSNGDGEAEADEQLETRDRPLSRELTASAAHEICNPLDSLLNLLHLMDAEPALTERGRHYLSLAQEEVRRIAQIARSTLNKEKARSVLERTDVGQLLTAVLDFYKQRLDSSGIAVQTRCSGDDSIPVYAGGLRQAFSNLLLNAVDAIPAEGGKIRTRVHEGHEWWGQQRPGVRVTVADNGCGIPSSMLPLLFQRGFTMKPEGHGMGLLFVKAVIQNHSGFVRVRSSTRPGRHGTVFSLFLPAALGR
jgi:signal transduction histidine kinase